MPEVGKKYNMLEVVSDLGQIKTGKRNHHFYLCKCNCGKELLVRSDQIGKNHSCGCIRKITSAKNAELNHKHKQTGTRLYGIWQGMKNRCHNPRDKRYNRYGGRGITICDEWSKDFSVFMKWAISAGYSDNLTIDRINNNKGYYPDNCRWATSKTQSRNRSTNIKIDGKCLKELSDELSIDYATLNARYKRGDSLNELLRPIGVSTGKKLGENNNKAIITNAQAKEIKQLIKSGVPGVEISKQFGVSKYLISDIKRGKTWKHIE